MTGAARHGRRDAHRSCWIRFRRQANSFEEMSPPPLHQRIPPRPTCQGAAGPPATGLLGTVTLACRAAPYGSLEAIERMLQVTKVKI